MVKKYYGLVGDRLNFAILAIAGLDFLLFGYLLPIIRSSTAS